VQRTDRNRNGLKLVAALVLLGLPAVSAAQGSVTGRVTIAERPGEQTSDLGNTVIYLVRKDGATPRLAATNTSIAMNGRAFVPRVRVVTTGSKVDFPNQDPFSHNIFSTTPGAVFDLGLYPAGRSKDATFRRGGEFPVYCNIHPRMTAFVVSVPTPHYAMAGADGRFNISGVPAGEYTLTVWHERARKIEQPLTVAATGVALPDVALDARGFRFVQHRDKNGREYTSSGRDRY
jgi:plastocyanin